MRPFLAAGVAVGLLLACGSSALAGDIEAKTDDDTVELGAQAANRQHLIDDAKEPDPTKRLVDWMQSPWCGREGYGPDATWVLTPCPDGKPPPAEELDCGGDAPQPPLWSRGRDTADAAWSEWKLRTSWYCPVDLLPELTAADFKVLPIAPSPLVVQPNRGWVLVNKETIAYSDDAEQTLRTQVLGVGVEVRVKPEEFRWDFGDGAPFTTGGPGHPYPKQDVSRVYGALGTQRISLTTTWSGRYRIDGDTRWRDVDGTATTVSTSPAFEVVERRSVLVDRG